MLRTKRDKVSVQSFFHPFHPRANQAAEARSHPTSTIADHDAVLRAVFSLSARKRWGLEPCHIDIKLVRGGKEARLLEPCIADRRL